MQKSEYNSEIPSVEWVDHDWLMSCIRDKVIATLSFLPLVQAVNGDLVKPADALIPYAEDEESRRKIWTISSRLFPATVPREEEQGEWSVILEEWSAVLGSEIDRLPQCFTVKKLAKQIEEIGSIVNLKTALKLEKDEEVVLAPNAVFLFSQFRQEIKTDLKKLQNKGFETQTLTNYFDGIKELLYQRIDEKVVREFLLNQVLSAYLLTVPGGFPGIWFATNASEYIHQAEKELASNNGDSTYLDMVHLSKGGGKATRIGLVPLELTFEEFSTKFNEVWSLAVKLYNEVEDSKIQVPLPCYITRIFPSEDGLKEIMPSDDIETKPLEVVRELIRDSITSEDSVSLLSLIQKAPNGKVALIKVIQAIFDSPKSNLLMMVADHVDDILSKSKTLMRKFEKKEIDVSLFHEYQATHVSHLGKKIAERSSIVGEQAARSEFRERTVKAMGDKSGITPEEIEILVGTIFKRLYSIGIALII